MKADDFSEISYMNECSQQKERHLLTAINKNKCIPKVFS